MGRERRKEIRREMTRAELVAALVRFNPWGGYCVEPCVHPGHSDESYRKTVRRLRGDWS